MGERKVELVQAWLLKASHDLEGPRLMIREPNPILDLAAYPLSASCRDVTQGLSYS